MKNSAIKQFGLSFLAVITSIISFNFAFMKNRPGLKQFLLSLLATTISIILTFGVSSILEHRKNEAAKKGLAMTIIYDMDQTIEKARQADSALRIATKTQMEIIKNPDVYDSLRTKFVDALLLSSTDFSLITQNIFSSNIETFSTIGNVNFINNVASFYQYRSLYKTQVIDVMKNRFDEGTNLLISVDGLLSYDFPTLFFDNAIWLNALTDLRNNCVKIMKLSEEDIREFSKQAELLDLKDTSNNGLDELMEEMFEAKEILKEARAKNKK